jgi:DnaJ family protein C protein 9
MRAVPETGVIPGDDGLGDLEGKSFDELYEYYRAMYQKVTQEEVEKWEKKYPGSEEEKEDLIDFYNKYGGNMKAVTECIPFCETEDLFRIKQVVDKLISEGKLEVRRQPAV